MLLRLHHQESHADLDWPAWVPPLLAASAVAVAVTALVQRDALVPPGTEALFALLAVLPWLAELVGWILPRWLFAAVVITGVGGLALGIDQTNGDILPFLLLLLAAEIAATASLRTGIATAIAGAALLMSAEHFGDADDLMPWYAGIAAGWVFGFAMQKQLRMIQQEQALRATLAAQAATEERRRIAREVHDVIAHSLSVTMLHLTGARYALETDGNVEEVVDALRDAERVGRQAMVDIRRTVGLLDAGEAATAPMPGLEDLDHLVHEFQEAGLALGYQRRGDPATLSLATSLGLYRIAQESLANVAKHGANGDAELTVDVAGDPVRLTVRSRLADGRLIDNSAPGGLGLKSMRQRAALLGGRLQAGPKGDTWCVEVTVPQRAEGT